MLCRNCKTELKSTSKFCPVCGTKVPESDTEDTCQFNSASVQTEWVQRSPEENLPSSDNTSESKQNLISAVLPVGIVIAVIVGLCMFGGKVIDPNPDMKTNKNDSTEDNITLNDIISLEELCDAYSSNAFLADKKYAGQYLNVQGEISAITPNSLDDTVSVEMNYIRNGEPEDYAFFLAYFEFDSSNEDLYNLSVGDTVILSGLLESGGGKFIIYFYDASLYGQENVSTSTPALEQNKIVFDTEFYSLELPEYWADLCLYTEWDIGEYSYGVAFYEEQSSNDMDGEGGELFTLALYDNEDYIDYPEYTYLGEISILGLPTYDIVATYPTDIQYSDKGKDDYIKLQADIPNVLASFQPQPDLACEYIPAN